MKIGIYSIYDIENISYDTPFFCVNDLQAKRHYIKISKDESLTLFHFPNSFELRRLGTFETNDGTIINEIETILDFRKLNIDRLNNTGNKDMSLENWMHYQPTIEELREAHKLHSKGDIKK